MTKARDLARVGSNAEYGLNFRNRIINGDMRIDQRNAGAAVTINSSTNTFAVDRFCGFGESSDGVYTLQQSSVAPAGFTNSLIATVTTADTSIGGSQRYFVRQAIEGFNAASLGWGTANASTVTLSFWVRSSLTGTFGGSFMNDEFNRAYPFTYTISAANTWEQKSITLAGDTTGTWLKTNGGGIYVIFSIGAGSLRVGTAGAWQTPSQALFGATGQTNIIATSGATWYLTGVQLEVGSGATPFESRPYGTELALCQRYCYKLMPGIQLSKMRELDRIRQGFYIMPVQMRTTVTVGAMATTDGLSVTIDNLSDRGFSMYLSATSDGMGAGINTQALVTAEL
jgi:hypothetical protein